MGIRWGLLSLPFSIRLGEGVILDCITILGPCMRLGYVMGYGLNDQPRVTITFRPDD